VDYAAAFEKMKVYAASRAPDWREQLWICEHPPVFTLGVAARTEHVLAPGNIPVVRTDRGGQVTYHGPGQVVAYPLIDLRRRGIYVKEYVFRLEQAALATLARFGVTGHRVAGAPGIYVRLADPFGHEPLAQRPQRRAPGTPAPVPDFSGLAKIAALGIKVSRQRAYHGLALNVTMDLEPFSRIDPCGYAGLQTIDLATIGVAVSWQEAAQELAAQLVRIGLCHIIALSQGRNKHHVRANQQEFLRRRTLHQPRTLSAAIPAPRARAGRRRQGSAPRTAKISVHRSKQPRRVFRDQGFRHP
jgi:lipoyl(octanoyl) transferase